MPRRLLNTLKSATNTVTSAVPPDASSGLQSLGSHHGSHIPATLFVLLGVIALIVIAWIASIVRTSILKRRTSNSANERGEYVDGRRIQAEEPDSGSDIGSHGHMSRRSSVYHGSPHGVTLTNKSLSSIATTPVKHTILVVQPDGDTVLAVDNEP